MEDDLNLDSVFPEPERPPSPEPKYSVFKRELVADDGEWQEIRIRLVGSHPLWGHYLWNSAIALANYLDDAQNRELYKDSNVLELGAGGALPSIVTAKNGAARVVVTDYPDSQLIENIEYNIRRNFDENWHEKISVQGYIWGQSMDKLLDKHGSFQLVILSDLIFNHSQHDALLKTCLTAAPNPVVLVFYTHHRPHLASRDMEFFDKARLAGWQCIEILTRKFPPMFPDDPGDEEVRSTVHGWKLTR